MVGLAGGLTGADFGGALVARMVLLVAAAVVEDVNAGALGFVSGGGPFPSLLACTLEFGAALDGRRGWLVLPSAIAASLRGCKSAPMFSWALRLSELVVDIEPDAIEGPERRVMLGPGGGPGLSGEEERNRGRRDMALCGRGRRREG